MKSLPYSADEDQLDFEAEDPISAADTSSMIDEDSVAGWAIFYVLIEVYILFELKRCWFLYREYFKLWLSSI